jgi:hypothetical protein
MVLMKVTHLHPYYLSSYTQMSNKYRCLAQTTNLHRTWPWHLTWLAAYVFLISAVHGKFKFINNLLCV